MTNDHIFYQLKLSNTLTGTKELFTPQKNNAVSLYVCGITPYTYAHIGHARCYTIFDVLYRLLTTLGYNVSYCRNITDIDDKLINRALETYGDAEKYRDLAQKFTAYFHEDLHKLNCLPPTYEPRVTESIQDIIGFVQQLIQKNKAYVHNGDVYFDIASFPAYGKLSKRTRDDMQAGARVAVREDKRNPMDFALWKKAETGPSWESPWGKGRPGWHIECSAMAKKILGETIDIHAGGMDLIFPHHENEIAQSEGLHEKTFARYWLHNAFVNINQEKMSKSLGNFITIRDSFAQAPAHIMRYYLIQHHYRIPLEFIPDDIPGYIKSYEKLCQAFAPYTPLTTEELRQELSKAQPDSLLHSLMNALCDDLNIAKFLGILFEHIKDIPAHQAPAIKALFTHILGLELLPEKKEREITPEMLILINKREEARAQKKWHEADDLRDQLRALGYEVQDKKL